MFFVVVDLEIAIKREEHLFSTFSRIHDTVNALNNINITLYCRLGIIQLILELQFIRNIQVSFVVA